MRSRIVWSLFAAAALTLAGCRQAQSDFNDFLTIKHDECTALHAWKACEENYEDHVHYLHDFGFGFQRGFMDVCDGGSGCPPVVPAEEYWCVKYQSPSGQERIEAWFQGYNEGVAVAEQSGVRGRNFIRISPFRRAQLTNLPTAAGPGSMAIPPTPYEMEEIPRSPLPALIPGAMLDLNVEGEHGLSSANPSTANPVEKLDVLGQHGLSELPAPSAESAPLTNSANGTASEDFGLSSPGLIP